MKTYLKSPSAIKIQVYSHYITVANLTFSTQEILREYAKRFINVEKRWVRKRLIVTEKEKYFNEVKKVVYEPSYFRFHRHCLKNIVSFLAFKGYTESKGNLIIKEIPIVKPVFVKHKWVSDKSDRDYQVSVIGEALDKKSKTKCISMQTGKGKTYCAFRIIQELGVRAWIVVLPKYIDRWLGDIGNHFETDGDELIVIGKKNKSGVSKGKEELIKFLSEPVPKNNQFVIMTTTSWSGYIKDYYENGSSAYPIPPSRFSGHIMAGIRVIDEVHEHFHTCFLTDLYTNIEMTLSLSATVEPKNNPFRDQMLKIAIPMQYRICPPYDRYIEVYAYKYSVANPMRLKYRGFGGMYSHIKFEQSILKYVRLKNDYFNFIYHIIEDTFLHRRLKDHRLLLLFHQTDMADGFCAYLKKKLPNFAICVYHGKSRVNYEGLDDYQIIVSTKSSCGASVDIPNLLTTIMPACEEANTGNEQALGRTRKLADGTTPYFVYTACKDVAPQISYHESKVKYFRPMVLSQKVIDDNIIIGE